LSAGLPWLAVAGLLSVGSSLLFALGEPAAWALERTQPQRLLVAGLTHWTALHWIGNLFGLGVLGLLGRRAGLGSRDALAWLLAGPLAHALLLLHPALPPYAGLSTWLHAGVAVAAIALLRRGGQTRWIGLAIAIGLLVKLLLEQPWGPLLRPGDWWGGATLPLAHLAGVAVGALLGSAIGARPQP
jgi:hypothetical protein